MGYTYGWAGTLPQWICPIVLILCLWTNRHFIMFMFLLIPIHFTVPVGSEERLAPLLASWKLGVQRRILQLVFPLPALRSKRSHERNQNWFKGKTLRKLGAIFTLIFSLKTNPLKIISIWLLPIRLLKSPFLPVKSPILLVNIPMFIRYPPVTNITMENHHVSWENPL